MTEIGELRMLDLGDIGRIAEIDRSEQIDTEYTVVAGELTRRRPAMTFVPSWDPAGDGEHSVAVRIAFCEPLVRSGASLLGVFEGETVCGLAVVDGSFEPPMAWLAFLHVSRPFRRQGVATALWEASVEIAKEAGATSLYVSATPSGSAVGFYLSRGCRLADQVHPRLYAKEPDDIHLVCDLELIAQS